MRVAMCGEVSYDDRGVVAKMTEWSGLEESPDLLQSGMCCRFLARA